MSQERSRETAGGGMATGEGTSPDGGASGATTESATLTRQGSGGRPQLSVVVPTLGRAERLRPTLGAVLRELDARGGRRDEVVVVDDSGASLAEGTVAEILGAAGDHSASVRVVSTRSNKGFSAAVSEGVRLAKGELMLVLHDDVVLAEGALAPLLESIEDDSVFAASPVVRRGSGPPETASILALADDRFIVRETGGETGGEPGAQGPDALRELTFVPSSAFAVRRARFLELGGFDSLFAPFSFEDVDLSIRARRRGMRLVEVSASRAEHGTPPSPDGDRADTPDGDLGSSRGEPRHAESPEVASSVIERNRLLLRWKHLQARAEATEHLVSLWRRVLEAGMTGDRETLQNVCLAFAKLPEVNRSRATTNA